MCRDLPQLARLRESAGDAAFQKEWAAVKRVAKVKAAAFIEQRSGVKVNPDAMFDVQVRLPMQPCLSFSPATLYARGRHTTHAGLHPTHGRRPDARSSGDYGWSLAHAQVRGAGSACR